MPTQTDTIYNAMRDTLVTTFTVPADDIEPTTTLGELDLDSLALAELAVILSEKLDVTVTEGGVTADHSLADFAAHIHATTDRNGA
ncbi:hypothetical protein Stsp01_19740 [Streptomyces sp. NBRC 13847]|uniref:acyl carrier protein n=1 Tax=Streptomyces TaxID=1883 RepID=UPI0024A16B97|nr:acyl carrier protein [Streptomyces sp. NBRC 13847]GLW15231.1 hypothetical protein Stsp01_19740 [Streptomyces sp. NBRC 13847]